MDKQERYTTIVKLLADSSNSTANTRKAILMSHDERLLRIISETALNILQAQLPITKYYKNRLAQHVDVIRKLGSKGVKPSTKRKLCYTKANEVGLMLKAVLPHLIALINSDSNFFG